jgi:CHAT domain-containing protein/predicted negative regulator of RcsB-dependent stress response
MKTHALPSIREMMLSWVIILSFLGRWCAGAEIRPVTDEKVREEYYRFLNTVLPDSSINQIAALQDFLSAHPEFELVYHKLFERYLLHQKIYEAKEYFRALAAKPLYRRNSCWVLAKIFALQNDVRAAFEAYAQALQAGPPSLALLKNVVDFNYKQAGKLDAPNLWRGWRERHEEEEIISVFMSHQNKKYDQALKALRQIPEKLSHSPLVLHVWGDCFYRLGQDAQADSLWRIGLATARREGDRQFQAQFFSNLGVLARAAGKYDRALSYYDSAYAIASRIDDLHLRQLILANRGNIYNIRGNYAAAAEHYEEAIELATLIGADGYASIWYSNSAGVLFQLGRFNDVLKVYDKSEELAYRANDDLQRLELKMAKADLYAYLNQLDFAGKVYQEVYDLAQTKNLIEYQQRAKVKFADFLSHDGKFDKARKAYQEYLDFLGLDSEEFGFAYCGNQNRNRIERAYWLGKLASTYETEGHYGLARGYYEQALKTAVEAELKTDEAWYLLKIAGLDVIAGKINEALPRYEAALKTAAVDTNVNLLTQINLGFGNAYKKAGDLTKAIASYMHAAEHIEDARQKLTIEQLRIGFFSTQYEVYQKLSECFFQRYEMTGNPADLDSIYICAQLSRSRSLQDSQGSENRLAYNHDDGPHANEYKHACEQLRLLQRQLRQKVEAARPFEELAPLLSELETARYSVLAQRLRLVQANPAPSQSPHSPARPLLALGKNLQQTEAALLLYHLSQENSFVLVAVSDSVKVVRLPVTLSALAASIDSLLRPFHLLDNNLTKTMPFRAAIAHRLYLALVKPAEEALHLPSRLLIVPDLALMNLPFEMLMSESPDYSEYTPSDFPSYADHFLLQRYKIIYSPGAALSPEISPAVAGRTNVLVFANAFSKTTASAFPQPQLAYRTGWNFAPLTFSRKEANDINKVYSNTKIYERDQATKEKFFQEASNYKILHLATHAFADTTFDAFSGLVLAASPDSTDDGILMGYEISDLNLKCDLITLSACETGRGKLVAGEGVLGLPRLFLGAGAKTVLMTQWKVDDKFASELMPEFYSYLLKKKLSKTDALSEAKRAMLLQKRAANGFYYQHPFYWAAFVLYGDPGMSHSAWSPIIKFTIALVAILILAGFLIYPRYIHRHKLWFLSRRFAVGAVAQAKA